jgi:hypothetical protein
VKRVEEVFFIDYLDPYLYGKSYLDGKYLYNVDVTYKDGKPIKLVVINDGIEFTVTQTKASGSDYYVCSVTLDKENLDKLKSKDSKLYWVINSYIKTMFWLKAMNNAIDYVIRTYSGLVSEEETDFIKKLLIRLVENNVVDLVADFYDDTDNDYNLDKLLSEVQLEVKIPVI